MRPVREGGVKGHPTCQENSGGWEAATGYSREERCRQGISLPIGKLNGNASAKLPLKDAGH